MKKAILLILLCSFNQMVLAQHPTAQTFSGYDRFVKKVLADWRVNGAVIAVVSKDSIIYSKSFGFRDSDQKLSVTPETVFPIASMAKPFITLSMLLLESEGMIKLNEPINQYLTDIEFSDTQVQKNLTVKDLMLHRSGYAKHEEIWHLSDLPRKELILKWSKLTPDKPFRDEFQYSEMSYHLLCHLADRTASMPWEEYVTNKIFKPLGFQHTSFGPAGLTNSPNYSQPFIEVEDSVRQVQIRKIGVSGELNSSVLDLACFLQLFMNQGKHNGMQVVPEVSITEMIQPRIVVPGYQNRTGFNASYGYGWIVDNYRDHRIIEHNGQTEGYSGWLSFLPEEEIGIVILTNNDYSPVTTILKNNLLDRILELSQIDYNAELLKEKTK